LGRFGRAADLLADLESVGITVANTASCAPSN
jgi:hypothetical protein